jgi:hypothetical protein
MTLSVAVLAAEEWNAIQHALDKRRAANHERLLFP